MFGEDKGKGYQKSTMPIKPRIMTVAVMFKSWRFFGEIFGAIFEFVVLLVTVQEEDRGSLAVQEGGVERSGLRGNFF